MAPISFPVKVKVLTMGDKAPLPLQSPLTPLHSQPCSLSLRRALPQGLHTGWSLFLEHSSPRQPYNLFPHFLQGSTQTSPSHRGPPCAPTTIPLAQPLPPYLSIQCLSVCYLGLSPSPLSVLLGLVSQVLRTMPGTSVTLNEYLLNR